MKKVKRVTFKKNPKDEFLERFKPLYLLNTENTEQSDRICIFISQGEKNCYIQEKENWNQLNIEGLFFSSRSKTYCFSVGNIYRYLDISNHHPPYLTLAKNPRHKIFLKNLELSEEILQELALPHLEQLDTSAIVKTKKEAEKILQLKARNAEYRAQISQFKAILFVFREAREAMKKLVSDKGDLFTLEDIDVQIKLTKQQVHCNEYRIQKNEVEIDILFPEKRHLEPEGCKKNWLESRWKNKTINQDIQDLEWAMDKLKKMAESFITLNIPSEDPFIKERIDQQIQLFKERKLENELQLKNIQKNIRTLEKPKTGESRFLVTSRAKQLFFNSEEKNNPIPPEAKLKSLAF